MQSSLNESKYSYLLAFIVLQLYQVSIMSVNRISHFLLRNLTIHNQNAKRNLENFYCLTLMHIKTKERDLLALTHIRME